MHLTKIPLADTKAFSGFFLDYVGQKEALKPFYHRYPVVENFKEQIAEKSRCYPHEFRDHLQTSLRRQYASLDIPDAVKRNIDALTDTKTFTITTGHQLNIFTGPLYFIYKIVTVINTCQRLAEEYPQHTFVPVYWMASEDHDYDEINNFRLYGEKYVWKTDQRGAVGRFRTDGLKTLLESLPGDTQPFRDAYTKSKTLADAARHYVNALFGDKGLIVVDGDDNNLKSLFAPVIEDDILQHTTVGLVEKTNRELEGLGYKTQVHCRDINFFYLDGDIRSRIEKSNGAYQVLDTPLKFSSDDIRQQIRKSPEKFSPNVILRPLYQEWILPNLAYVGGPAENIYWLQLKRVFDHHKTPFPILMPRNFALVVDHTINRKLKKTGLDLKHFFEDKNFLYNHWTLANSHHQLTLGPEREVIRELYGDLRKRAEAIDPTLGPFTGAEAKRAMRSLDRIEHRMLRAEKRLHTDQLRQIEAVKDALFPNGGLQERIDNFLNFYQQDRDFINKLLRLLDPFDYRFHVMTCTDA